jgi:hypothetical protein
MTFGATFDGSPIVAAKSVPVATDTWTASYPSSAGGGGSTCAVAAPGFEGKGASGVWLAPVAFVAIRRRERRSSRALRGGSRPGRRG